MVNHLIGTRFRTAMKIPFILLVFSLLILPVAAATMEEHKDMNINGGDCGMYEVNYHSMTAMLQCRDECLNSPTCVATTYQIPGLGGPKAQCWRKCSLPGPLFSLPGATIWLKKEEPTTGWLTIQTTPVGAQIFLNGIAKNQVTNYRFDNIAAGTYNVRVSLAGYEDQSGTITVVANTGHALIWDLHPVTPAAPTTGSLSITSSPSGAQVYVDNGGWGKTPTTATDIAPGTHTVRVMMLGYGDYEGTATVTAGQTTPVTVSLSAMITTTQTASSQTTTQTTSTGSGSIEVRSQPSGATITFDGSQKGVTPAKLTNVKVGSHEVALSLAGYPDWKQTVTVKNGETASINAVLGTSTQTTGGQPAASGTGSLSVATEPTGAQVYVDGAFIGNSPTKTSGLSAGSHFLTFKMDGYLDLGVGVTITAGQATDYSTSLVSNPAGVNKRTPGFAAVLGILAIACIIAGRRLYSR